MVKKTTHIDKDIEKENSHALLVRIQIGAVTMEKRM